jgi:hypothetical protein
VSQRGPGRCCHTPALTVIGCHCLGVYTVILLSLLSFLVRMTVPPVAGLQRGNQ